MIEKKKIHLCIIKVPQVKPQKKTTKKKKKTNKKT